MSFQSIIEHMNEHHQDAMIDLCKKFGNAGEVFNVKLASIDLGGLDIIYNDNVSLRVEFPQKVDDESSLKDAVIALCQSAQKPDINAIAQEIDEFAKSFGSLILGTLSPKNEATCSYAPVIHYNDKFFIYVSEVAGVVQGIKQNPKNIEMMFLEDESKAKSIILRKRLRYRAEARFIDRDSSEFNAVMEQFMKQTGGTGGVKTIKDFLDFHLIELIAKDGRYVRGFGQAYTINDGKVTHLGGGGSPHKRNPHKAS